MMYEVETTDQAETDLREIYEYIAFELLVSGHASGQLDWLEAHIIRLGVINPEIGHLSPDMLVYDLLNGRSFYNKKDKTI